MAPDADLIEQRFTLQEQVGQGAFGEVYRAVDARSGRTVAVKRLLGDLPDGAAADRFDREARLVALVDSPYVVRYVAHGRDAGGRAWLVLEWLEGEDLRRRQAWRPLSVPEALEAARQAALGLDALHTAGIVHRDLKPSNFYLVGSPSGPVELKLIDLGTARAGGRTALTTEGWTVGTPAYMSPEQARGDADISALSDVFSLGIVLFELLTGRRPFRGADHYAILAKIVLEDAPRLSELVTGAPPELDTIVARALAKRPEHRFPSAREMSEELARLMARPSSRGGGTVELATLSRVPLGEEATVQVRMPRVSTLHEQRVVTAVFAGLVGEGSLGSLRLASAAPGEAGPSSRALGAGIDVMQRFAQIAVEHGAALHATLGSRMIAVFGGAHSSGDEGVRAAGTALGAAELPGVRLAMVTGRVHADSEGMGGDAIERGAALLDRYRGSVRLDAPTARLVSAHFIVEEEPDGAILRGERGIDDAPPMLLGRRTPCVGRDRELAVLEGIFEECATERVARVALVTGPAGIGKSRARHELLRRIIPRGEVEVIYGRGASLSAGSPFGMIAPAIRRAAGILDGEPLAAQVQKLRARLARRLEGKDLARVAAFVGELAQVPSRGDGDDALRAARADPMLMGDSMRSAWEDWLLAECSAHPVILVLDDLHWGDLPSVKAVDGALRHLRDSPFMVLSLARPDVHAQFPGLWAERAVHEIRLGPLSRKASERLVMEALAPEVAPETVARIVARAEGNAFYLEEMVRAVAAGGTQVLPADGSGGDDAIPDTVLGMVQARLDTFGAPAKRVLRAASIFGERFWRGGVIALVGGEQNAASVARSLDDLTSREVIAPLGTSRLPGELEYAFRHALVRDAAYAMLTDTDRRVGHGLAGEWLETHGEVDFTALAAHYRHGGKEDRALECARRAADQAPEGAGFATATMQANPLGARREPR